MTDLPALTDQIDRLQADLDRLRDRRVAELRRLHTQGVTLAELGRLCGMTRQAVHQLLNR